MISEIQIKEIVKKIVDNYHPDKIILFGSYAYETPTKDSDAESGFPGGKKKEIISITHEYFTY